MDGWMDGQMDRQIDRQTDRQIDIMTLYIYTQIDKIDKIDRYIMIYIYTLPGPGLCHSGAG